MKQLVKSIPTDRATLTIREVAQILGIGRSTAFKAIAENRIPSLQISERRRVVPVVALQRYLESAGHRDNDAA